MALLAQVGHQFGAQGGAVARLECGNHAVVLFHGVPPLLAVLIGAKAQRLQARIDLRVDGSQHRVLRSRVDGAVDRGVEPVVGRQVLSRVGCLHLEMQRLDLDQFLVADARRGQLTREALEPSHHLEGMEDVGF